MVDFTQQVSSPVQIENTVLRETKRDLSIDRAFHTYRDMQYDGTIAGSMSFIKSVLARDFWLKEHPEATGREKAITKALNQSLDNLKGYDKHRTVWNILSMLEYGSSLFEMVFERQNGFQVWSRFSPIHLTTVANFEFKNGELQQVRLNPAPNDGLVTSLDAEQKEVAGSKLVLFSLQPSPDAPLGRSLLHGCYQPWKAKQVMNEYALIGVAKQLSGVLQLSMPSEYIQAYLENPQSAEAQYVQQLLESAELMHAGKASYVVVPSDTTEGNSRMFDVSPLGGASGNGSDYAVNQSIDRMDKEIQLSLQSMLLSLGSSGGGSFNLAEQKTYLLRLFTESVQKSIAASFQKSIRLAFELNGAKTDRLPTVQFEETEQMDFETFSTGWQRLISSGAVRSTPGLDEWLRTKSGAPSGINDYDRLEDI